MSNNSERGSSRGRYKNGRRSYRQILKEHKGQWKPAAIDLLIDVVAGAAGAAVGAAIGRPSLIAGAVVNYLGHVLETQAVSTFGTGMAVVNVIQGNPVASLSGADEKSKWELAKERLMAYKDGLVHKLYLDKVFNKDQAQTNTSTSSTTTPVGEIKHFVYPYGDNNMGEIDLSALDEINSKLEASARTFQQNNKTSQSFSGTFDFADMTSDPLY